jgi:hypothetical protein
MCLISHALAFLIVANYCEYIVNKLGKPCEEAQESVQMEEKRLTTIK